MNPEGKEGNPVLKMMRCPYPKCKSESLRANKAGRIIRNIIDTFEFELKCDCEIANAEGQVAYEPLMKHLHEECEQVKNFNCCAVAMTKKQLREHLLEECPQIKGECKMCNESYTRVEINDGSVH